MSCKTRKKPLYDTSVIPMREHAIAAMGVFVLYVALYASVAFGKGPVLDHIGDVADMQRLSDEMRVKLQECHRRGY